jgi:hypothetical protein
MYTVCAVKMLVLLICISPLQVKNKPCDPVKKYAFILVPIRVLVNKDSVTHKWVTLVRIVVNAHKICHKKFEKNVNKFI